MLPAIPIVAAAAAAIAGWLTLGKKKVTAAPVAPHPAEIAAASAGAPIAVHPAAIAAVAAVSKTTPAVHPAAVIAAQSFAAPSFVAGPPTARGISSAGPQAAAKAAQANAASFISLQQKLNDLGFGPLTVDGKNGPQTQGAVKKFQASKGLKVDGVAGPITYAALGATQVVTHAAGLGNFDIDTSTLKDVSPGEP
jgi:hypothetical protein